MIYGATLEYSARSKPIDILPKSYIAMALYCNLYGTGLIDYEQVTWPFKYRKLLLAYLSWCHVRLASCAQLHALFYDTLCICKQYRQIGAKNKSPNFEVRVGLTMLNAL
jgi:hypothetical protein